MRMVIILNLLFILGKNLFKIVTNNNVGDNHTNIFILKMTKNVWLVFTYHKRKRE